ncbi:trypsin-like peptidase domain-containing protein [Streptomyces sp. NPDC059009]|uniref:trypsin-like peptidase domain-containing protein n=1 Tax=Streptomyces sp. NPDC059009 TaxID=3346694 RepID=UPI003687BEBD
MRNSPVDHRSWRVRLREWGPSGGGEVLGAGVLLGSDRVLTCAHVVLDPGTGRAPERVQVDFPLLQGLPRTPQRTATVVPGHWLPPFGRAQGDLALLALDTAAPITSPVTLHRTLDYRDTSVLIDGFPEFESGGQWLTGACRGPGGAGDERVQIDLTGPHAAERGLREGFSGAGVLEDGTDRVLGIVVQADESGGRGYMIPAATVSKYFSRFAEQYVTGPHAIPGPRVVSADAARAARPHGLQRTVNRWLEGPDAAPAGQARAWDTEVLFIAEDDARARQALDVVLNLAAYEQSPQLPLGNGTVNHEGGGSGAPLLSRAGLAPRVGSINLVLDVEGVALDRPEQGETREALAVLRHMLRHAGSRRPAVAVLGADRSATDPAAAVHVLRELADAGARLLLVVRDSKHGFPYAMAEHLLPADRADAWLERIGDRVAALAATERRARGLFRRVERRVVDPPRATDYAARGAVWTVQLTDELREQRGQGREQSGPIFLEKLSYAEQAVETYLLRAERAERALQGVLDEHLRLRALLADHQARLAAHGLAEHPGAVDAFAEAQHLLMAGPCPLPDAERAVAAYARVVRRVVGEHDGPDEEGAEGSVEGEAEEADGSVEGEEAEGPVEGGES